MEAPEVPTEHLHESIHEHAHTAKEKWQSFVALTTALVAALAAVASLLAGKFDTEATLEQIKASDQWSYFQAKSIKESILSNKIDQWKTEGKAVEPKDEDKLKRYKEESESIKAQARSLEKESQEHLDCHEALAASVTLFQISIAVAAISVLMRRKSFFYGALVAAGIGLLFFCSQLPFVIKGSLPHAHEAESSGH